MIENIIVSLQRNFENYYGVLVNNEYHLRVHSVIDLIANDYLHYFIIVLIMNVIQTRPLQTTKQQMATTRKGHASLYINKWANNNG